MSEPLKFSSKEVKDWLQRETSSIFIPVHEQAEKLLGEMEGELEEVIDVSKMLFENSKKEIEKRSKKTYGRARALNKLARLFIKRMRQIEVPEEVFYDSFDDFIQQTRKAFIATEVDIKNWFSRISPYFILDRRKFLGAFEKSKESLKELQSFLEKEYVKTKTLEETFQLIDNLLSIQGQLAKLEVRKKKTETKKASIEREIAETRQKMKHLKNRESLTQIHQIRIEIKRLRKKVKHELRHLRKPFIKFQRLVFRKGGLTPEESKKLKHYAEKPFNAFATEETGYSHLKTILRKIDLSISDGKLKLKHSRRRKAKEDIDNIMNKDSLDALHKECREAVIQKKQLSTSAETEETKRELRKLRNNLKRLKRRKKRVELEENAAERDLKETREKMHDQKNEIEKNVFDFMSKRILIELKVQ